MSSRLVVERITFDRVIQITLHAFIRHRGPIRLATLGIVHSVTNPHATNAPSFMRTDLAKYATVALLAGSAVILFGLYDQPLRVWGFSALLASVALSWCASKRFAKDILLIALGLGILRTISLEANISWPNMFLMGAVLGASVFVPYALSRWVYRDHAIRFPTRKGRKWSRLEFGWLAFVVIVGWLVLPRYFFYSGAYLNWPAVVTPSEISRLFIGVNAVGIWDELFFICTVFTLLHRHFSFWPANIVTSIIFVSFLWELGYRSWAPLITIPFALVQAVIFTRTKSLPYTVTVHLLFDAVVFLSIVHAHHPQALPIFWY